MPLIAKLRRNFTGHAVVVLHAAVVFFVLMAPTYAFIRAVAAPWTSTDGSGASGLIDLNRWRILLVNTAIVCTFATTTALLLGTCFGFLIARTNLPGRRILFLAAMLGACVPLYVGVVFVFALFPPWRLQGSAAAGGVMHGVILAPLATLVLTMVFRAADGELEDQARLEMGEWSVFFKITLPHAGWGVAIAGIIVTILTATDHTIADVLIVRTFAEEIYTQYALDHSASGPLLVGLPVMFFLGALLLYVQRRYRFFGENAPWHVGAPPRTLALGRWRLPAAAAAFAAAALLIGPPAWAVLKRVGWSGTLGATIATLQAELWRTLLGAGAGATLIVLFAVGLAWTLCRTRRARWAVLILIVVLLGLPAPMIGISLIELLNRPNLLGRIYDSPVAVIAGYVTRFMPLGILIMLPAIRRVPIELEQAARVDGCDWPALQRRLYWPMTARHAAVAWLVLVILCFGEAATTVLLAPPGWPLSSVRAYTLIHFGVYRDLAVLALLSIGYILVPWMLLLVLLRRRLAEAL